MKIQKNNFFKFFFPLKEGISDLKLHEESEKNGPDPLFFEEIVFLLKRQTNDSKTNLIICLKYD